jgi:hypothetical protein
VKIFLAGKMDRGRCDNKVDLLEISLGSPCKKIRAKIFISLQIYSNNKKIYIKNLEKMIIHN